MKYEVVIGLEIHLELLSRSKLFCGCSTAFGLGPNTNCCPVCLGLPGSLPVFNRKAIELAVTAALALKSEVQINSRFDRKNYFYPDLPKAYQVSQYDQPLARGGCLEIELDKSRRKVSLERIHLEEEAGKLVHAGESIIGANYSLVDYNRAGIPLLEIVTAPNLYSGHEARLFLEELHSVLLYCSVSDCKMEEGSLRCDSNISLRPAGSPTLGTRTEVKNMNSFRSVEMALEFEAKRQESILTAGGSIIQETFHWDEEKKHTFPLRSKEESSDYRYFPEPDLLPLVLESSYVEKLAERLPMLPQEHRLKLLDQYQLKVKEAVLLTRNRELGDFFETAAVSYSDYRNLINWVQGDLLYQLRESGRDLKKIDPRLFAELLIMVDDGKISRPVAKELLAEMVQTGANPGEMVENRHLGLISSRESLMPVIEQVILENPDAVDNYRQGKKKALAFLVGKVMAVTGGRADPAELNRLLKEKLK